VCASRSLSICVSLQFLHAIADELCGRSVDYTALFALKGGVGSGGASSDSDITPVVSACKDVLSACIAGGFSEEQARIVSFYLRIPDVCS
jgi:hypothetical protein